MDASPRHFGELRSLLQQPPSEMVWMRVCEHLEGLDAQMLRDEVIPYIEGHLARWSHQDRTAPQHWVDRFLRGQDMPQLTLCTRLWRRKGTTSAEIGALGRSPEFAQITIVELVSCLLDAPVVAHLTDPRCYPALTHIDLSFNHCGDEGARLIAAAPKSGQLLSLRMDQCHISDDGAQAIARSPHLANLHTLTLYNNPLGHWGVEELRRSPHLSIDARRPWLFVREAEPE